MSCRPAHFSPEARQVVQRKYLDLTRLNNEFAKVETAVSNTFILAPAQSRPVTEAELVAVARQAMGKKPAGKPAPAALVAVTPTGFYAFWQAVNPGQAYHSARRYKQTVGHLKVCQTGW